MGKNRNKEIELHGGKKGQISKQQAIESLAKEMADEDADEEAAKKNPPSKCPLPKR